MSDSLSIRGIAARCRIGTTAQERRKTQEILLSVRLEVPLKKAGLSDDLADAPDYQALENLLRATSEEGERTLVESLAEDLARVTLGFDHRIRAVTLRARKRPSLLPKVRDVVVEIRRTRS